MRKYKITKGNEKVLNRYGLFMQNAVTAPDARTKITNSVIPDETNVEAARDWQQEGEK